MFCASTRPRYQVSVYKTIGPLVYFWSFKISRKYSETSENIVGFGIYFKRSLCYLIYQSYYDRLL